MFKGKGIVSLLFLALWLFFPLKELRADNLSCLVCHGALEGTYTTRQGVQTSLFVNGEKFAASVHADLECTDCHLKYQDNPHASPGDDVDEEVLGLSRAIEKKSPVDPIAQAACVQCHPDIYEQVKGSVHGINIFEKKEVDGPLCVDCHGSPHEIVSASAEGGKNGLHSRVAYDRIVSTCGRCHEKKSISLKYGLSTEIVERYEESFHGKKYHLGGTNLPACTTCHGAHDIHSHKDPRSPVYGDNKIALCSQCHKGANTEFVAAITHKPLGKDNPIPYYAEKGLILLTFTVITGCVLHVILQVFAFLRDAFRTQGRMSR